MKGKVANWKRRAGETSVENTWRLQTGNQLAGKVCILALKDMLRKEYGLVYASTAERKRFNS